MNPVSEGGGGGGGSSRNGLLRSRLLGIFPLIKVNRL